MKHIYDKLIETVSTHATQLALLIAIQNVDWTNLPQDTLVYVGSDFSKFCFGKVAARHFSNVDLKTSVYEPFICFTAGRSSATAQGGVAGYIYALPIDIYLTIIPTPTVQETRDIP